MLGVGAAGLAGCMSNSTESNETDTGENEAVNNEAEIPDYTPENSRFVRDGELTVRPFVDVFGFEGMTDNTLEVIMTAMPNPTADYEINVYYTPLSKVDSQWEIQSVRSEIYGGLIPEYDSNSNEWETLGGNPTVIPVRDVQENGTQIGSITVPSETAGLIAHDVENPFKSGAVEAEFEDGEITELSDEERKQLGIYLQRNVPSLGDRYTDFVQEVIDETPIFQTQFTEITGSWVAGTGAITPPFVKSFEYNITDEEIADLGLQRDRNKGFPEQEPFVLTFTVDDPNAANNDPEKVVSQTPTAIPDPDNPRTLYTPNVKVPMDNTDTWLQKDWTQGLIDGRNWEDVGLDELYQNIDHSNSDDTTSGRVSRITNFGRYSPKMEDFTQEIIESTAYSSGGTARFLASDLYAYLDSPLQAAWTVDYEIDENTVQKAQSEADRIKNNNTRDEIYEKLAVNASEYDAIQDVTAQLRDVCDQIGTETPTEEIRVVADFVSYLTHIALDEDPPEGSLYGMGTKGPQHPVWTLYHQTGDCQDFTILANTILSMDEFGYSPSAGVVHSLTFSREDADITHISTGVPVSELEIDDVREDALLQYEEEGRAEINGDVTFSHRGETYMYVEMSGAFPMGTSYGVSSQGGVDPDPVEEWSRWSVE